MICWSLLVTILLLRYTVSSSIPTLACLPRHRLAVLRGESHHLCEPFFVWLSFWSLMLYSVSRSFGFVCFHLSSSSSSSLSSDVTIQLYRFRSISIRLFDQQFDLDSTRFRFFTICTLLLTQLDSCVATCERQCCGAGHPRSYPPHRCRRRRLEQGRCWVGKYRLNSVVLWHGVAKLDSATAHIHCIHCFSAMRPVFIVRCANQPYSSK